MKDTDPLLALIVTLGFFALITITLGIGCSPERPEVEKRERGNIIEFEGSGIFVEIITIDGVEYIVTKCRDGVGVCRK